MSISETWKGPRITAQEPPCSCGAKRWFMCVCLCTHTVYEFAADGCRPTQAQIAYVRELHPDADLIYLD